MESHVDYRYRAIVEHLERRWRNALDRPPAASDPARPGRAAEAARPPDVRAARAAMEVALGELADLRPLLKGEWRTIAAGLVQRLREFLHTSPDPRLMNRAVLADYHERGTALIEEMKRYLLVHQPEPAAAEPAPAAAAPEVAEATASRRHEIHAGQPAVIAPPTRLHQRVLGNLFLEVGGHVRARGLGELYFAPFDCLLDERTVVEPDLVFVERGALARLSQRGLEGIPALVVEVLTTATAAVDAGAKRDLYARYRIPYYWLVDPDARRIDALKLGVAGYELAARLSGADPAVLPPFLDLRLEPSVIWG